MEAPNSNVKKELIDIASEHIRSNYVKGKHHIAAALKTKTNIYLSLHLDTKGFDVCAEPIAISNALADNGSEFEYIVAVILNSDNTTSVISPCGNCRQILLEYIPSVSVIIDDQDHHKTSKPSELLPNPY